MSKNTRENILLIVFVLLCWSLRLNYLASQPVPTLIVPETSTTAPATPTPEVTP